MLQRTKLLKKRLQYILQKYQKSEARKKNQLGKTSKQTTTVGTTKTRASKTKTKTARTK